MVWATAVNYFAVLVGAIAVMVVGYIWYSPMLFGNTWMKEVGVSAKDMKKKMGKALISGFIAALIMAFALEVVVKTVKASAFVDAVALAVLVWLGFFLTAEMTRMAFEGTSMNLFLMQSAHHLVVLLVVSIILVSMH